MKEGDRSAKSQARSPIRQAQGRLCGPRNLVYICSYSRGVSSLMTSFTDLLSGKPLDFPPESGGSVNTALRKRAEDGMGKSGCGRAADAFCDSGKSGREEV